MAMKFWPAKHAKGANSKALYEPRSAAVPVANCGGVSPPARTPGETPVNSQARTPALRPPGSSWSQCIRKNERGLTMNEGAAGILPEEESGRISADETSA